MKPFLIAGRWCWLTLLLLLAGPRGFAQAPVWQGLITANNFGAIWANATAVDASGNVYITGGFYSTAYFGTTLLTSVGANDIFVAKWSPATGRFLWAIAVGSNRDDEGTALVVQGSSVYLAGNLQGGSAVFGSSTVVNTGGGLDGEVFVAKLVDAGTSAAFVWGRAVAYGTSATALAVSGTELYVAGTLTMPTTFGSTVLTPIGGYDIFVARLHDAGTSASYAWAQRLGTADYEGATAIAVNGPNVYIAGRFTGPALTLGTTTLTNQFPGPYDRYSTADLFVAKLTDTGAGAAVVWAQAAGGISTEEATALAVSGPNVYLLGRFRSATASFGPFSVVSPNPATTYSFDVFLAKLTDTGAAGTYGWAQSVGSGNYNDYASNLRAVGNSVYLAGYFDSDTVRFGALRMARVDPSQAGFTGYVARLLDAGSTSSFAWAVSNTSGSFCAALDLAVTPTAVYVAGSAGQYTTFGNQVVLSAGSNAFSAILTNPVLGVAAGTVPLAGFTVAPNPARGTATVQLPALPGAATLTVLDALGRTVRTQSAVSNARAELDLAGLPAGLYVVRVAAGSSSATRRLVVE